MTAPTAGASGSRSRRDSLDTIVRRRIITYAVALGLVVTPHPGEYGWSDRRQEARDTIEAAQQSLNPPPRRTKAEMEADAKACRERARETERQTRGNVYRALARHTDANGITWISFYTLAHRALCDISTAKRAVKDLCRLGWILKLPRLHSYERLRLRSEPSSNVYMVLLRPLEPEHFARMRDAQVAAWREVARAPNGLKWTEKSRILTQRRKGAGTQKNPIFAPLRLRAFALKSGHFNLFGALGRPRASARSRRRSSPSRSMTSSRTMLPPSMTSPRRPRLRPRLPRLLRAHRRRRAFRSRGATRRR